VDRLWITLSYPHWSKSYAQFIHRIFTGYPQLYPPRKLLISEAKTGLSTEIVITYFLLLSLYLSWLVIRDNSKKKFFPKRQPSKKKKYFLQKTIFSFLKEFLKEIVLNQSVAVHINKKNRLQNAIKRVKRRFWNWLDLRYSPRAEMQPRDVMTRLRPSQVKAGGQICGLERIRH
jgi:hypothetical protein